MNDDASNARSQFRSVRDAVWNCHQIGTTAKIVALRLVEHWPRIFPAIASICEFTELSERAVRDALRELERKRVITTTRRRGTSSTYAFVGVSIPALGSDDGSGDEGEPRHETPPGQPRHELPSPPAAAAPPPRQELPPKQGNLRSEMKLGGARKRAARGKPRTPPTLRLVFHTSLDGWQPSAALRSEARRLGLSDAALDNRIARLRLTRIGGRGGVSDRDAYVTGWLEQWSRWEAENLEKAQRRAGIAPRTAFWGGGDAWEPSQKMKAYAGKHGLDIDTLGKAFVTSGEAARLGGKTEADEAFIKRLVAAARAKLMSDPRAFAASLGAKVNRAA